MVTPELLRFLFQYNAWADRRLLDACGSPHERTIHAQSRLEFQFRARHGCAPLRRGIRVE